MKWQGSRRINEHGDVLAVALRVYQVTPFGKPEL